MDKTRILIVEDQALFRELLHRTLAAEAGVEVIGEAVDGEAAVRLTNRLKPDVILMDIELSSKLDGVEAAIQIKKLHPEIGIVILSIHGDRRYVTSLPIDRYRGWAYLLKQTVPDIATLLRAIEGSKSGMLVLDPALVNNLRPRQDSILAKLTRRQQEVLGLIAQGYNNAAIAERLNLSEKSVETYINIIYQELGLSKEPHVHGRVKAALLYLQNSQGDA